MNVKLGYIVDESQVQGTFGFGKVYSKYPFYYIFFRGIRKYMG